MGRIDPPNAGTQVSYKKPVNLPINKREINALKDETKKKLTTAACAPVVDNHPASFENLPRIRTFTYFKLF